jgi:hypothetical protein|tara:strand:+ start:252 stop:494 length:243 start_codon:yes stop_codon:yes gene_type:complete
MTGKTKIRLLTGIAGSLTGNPGDVVECDTVFALRLIDTNQAEPVDADRIAAQPEAAVMSAPETATRKRATSRSKRGRSRG